MAMPTQPATVAYTTTFKSFHWLRRHHQDSFEALQRRGMGQDLSWDNAAQQYEEVFVDAKYQW